MKMEHVVEAPYAGVVSAVCVGLGEQVSAGTVLLQLGSPDAAASSGSADAEVDDNP
jgi:pyruvate/2-oxoglutarate dehydrogenase complex dihydrolipoamide acyltransferase (E2) component